MSFNSPSKNQEWAEKEHFPFELWSDTNKQLALYHGAVRTRLSPLPGRTTVLLDAQGEVLLEYLDGIEVGTHPSSVLEDCRRLFEAAGPPSP